MGGAGVVTLVYAIIVFIGGVMGHVQARSYASLIVGSLFGILLALSAIGMRKDGLFSAYIAVLCIFLLTAFFTFRWLYTFSFFPAGVFSLISLATALAVTVLIRRHLRRQRRDRK